MVVLAGCDSVRLGATPTHTATFTLLPTPTATTPPTPTITPVQTTTLSTTFGENQRIELRTDDHRKLQLALWYYPPEPSLEKPLAVLLGHESGGSHWRWHTIAEMLASEGYHVFSLDFRGHGDSEGSLSYPTIGIDARTALIFIYSMGFERVGCIGASMGGSGCLAAAVDVPIAGLGMLSSPMNIPSDAGGTILVSYDDLETMTFPKLFIITEEDSVIDLLPSFVTDFMEMAERAPEPKQFYIYPGIQHGTGMFWDEQHGEEVQQNLFSFIAGLAEDE
jgi:dienelactone hydrolase